MECWVYSKASENTGIEKSTRYILKPKEIIPINAKIRKIFFLENNLVVRSFKSTWINFKDIITYHHQNKFTWKK